MRQPESLLQFFGAYFHQDWGVESPDWQGVVAMFIHDSSAQDIAAVTAGVEHLARGASSEAELERILLNELGCYYTPRPDRPEKRRVGKECVRRCRSRWSRK